MVDNLLWCFTFPPTQLTVFFESKSPILYSGAVCFSVLPVCNFDNLSILDLALSAVKELSTGSTIDR